MPAPSPIALFAFNRPQHLARTLAALADCPEARLTSLTIYCDGPRRDADNEAVAAVRAVAQAAQGFGSLAVVTSDANLGLAASIIRGVGAQLAASERVIVIEDDLVVSPHFLRYMNQGLDLYADEPRVASIHGYTYPTGEALPETFFQRGADCWGWATWARAWRHFEPDGGKLLARLQQRRLTRQFDLEGSCPNTRMLEDQIAGRNDSWAIRWHAACFLDELLTLYPGRTLVENIGNDSSGTHCRTTDNYTGAPSGETIAVRPIPVEESRAAREAFRRFHRRNQSLRQRVRGVLAGAMSLGH
ncbi:MAG: glycosyltransferase [Burkholderiaceae bacterium]|nr:glycosyltransferase [Burkholderiaceae bacterium]